MTFRRGFRVGSWAAGLMLALVGTVLADEVVLIPGSTFKQATGGRVRGSIQAETASEVEVKLGANAVKVPTDQILSVRYDGQPASMALAETNESTGQLEKAAELYKKAATEASAKPLIEQAAKYKQAELTAESALTDPSKAAGAVALLDAFVKAYPSGRSTSAALENLARLQMQKNDYASVEKTIASIEKLPHGADRAAVLRAKISAKKGDYDKSLEELEKLIKSSAEGTSRRRDAQLAHAESLAGLKKYADAETEVRGVIKALPPEDVASQSIAYNTLGDCLRAAGRPKDALLAYLHTDVLYSKDKEQHPRALFQIEQLWRQLKRDDRADEVHAKLKQEYPQSPWATARATP
jgi:tetratricopeptide (TPR) repeat protein